MKSGKTVIIDGKIKAFLRTSIMYGNISSRFGLRGNHGAVLMDASHNISFKTFDQFIFSLYKQDLLNAI